MNWPWTGGLKSLVSIATWGDLEAVKAHNT